MTKSEIKEKLTWIVDFYVPRIENWPSGEDMPRYDDAIIRELRALLGEIK